MKIQIMLVSSAIMIVCSSFFCQSPKITIKEIVIKHVDYDIETIYKITCDNFEKEFKNGFYYKKVTNIHILKSFFKYEYGLKPNPRNYLPDVRIKVIIYKNDGTTDMLCLDGGNAGTLNGKPMLVSNEFISFIKKID